MYIIENISSNVIDIIKSVGDLEYHVMKKYYNGNIDVLVYGGDSKIEELKKKIWG